MVRGNFVPSIDLMFADFIIVVAILHPNYSLKPTYCTEPLHVQAFAHGRNEVDALLAQLRSTNHGLIL